MEKARRKLGESINYTPWGATGNCRVTVLHWGKVNLQHCGNVDDSLQGSAQRGAGSRVGSPAVVGQTVEVIVTRTWHDEGQVERAV
jgi:hypothetical protein